MNGFLITDNCKQASKNFRSYRINIIFVSSRLGILRSSIGLRLNTAMKLSTSWKEVENLAARWTRKVNAPETGGWGSTLSRIAPQSLTVISSRIRGNVTDGTVTSADKIFVRLSNHDIPSFPIVPTCYSHWSTMIFRKLWKWTIVTCEKRTRILFSVIYDWYFENYENSNDRGRFYSHWSTIKLWKFYSNDRGTWKANDFIDALVLDREIWLEENSTWIYIID